MTYSNELFDNIPAHFPPPPAWLTWTQSDEGGFRDDPTTGRRAYFRTKLDTGKLRHHDTIQTAKKNVTWTGRDGFFTYNWAIYEWVGDHYELRFSGKVGEEKATNPLFVKGTVRSKKSTPIQVVGDDEMDRALRSIMGEELLR